MNTLEPLDSPQLGAATLPRCTRRRYTGRATDACRNCFLSAYGSFEILVRLLRHGTRLMNMNGVADMSAAR